MARLFDKILLQLTYSCDKQCDYCCQKHARAKFGDKFFDQWAELKNLIEHIDLSDSVTVQLAGGEISMFPSKIIEAVEYFRKIEQKKMVRFKFQVITNGYDIDSIVLLYKKGYIDICALSYDFSGPKNNDELLAKLPDYFLVLVSAPRGFRDTKKIDSLINLRKNNILLYPLIGQQYSKEDVAFYKKYFNYFKKT